MDTDTANSAILKMIMKRFSTLPFVYQPVSVNRAALTVITNADAHSSKSTAQDALTLSPTVCLSVHSEQVQHDVSA